MTNITHCSKTEARVLAKYGHQIFSELDKDLNPSRFFTMDGVVVVGAGKKRSTVLRRPKRGYVPADAYLKLTGTEPTFNMRNTMSESVYIATMDLLTKKKNLKGKIRRDKLVVYLMEKLNISTPVCSCSISYLLYTKNALEKV